MLNSTLGMDIWIGMAESAWICPECETTATHKQGKGKKSTLMGGQEKKMHGRPAEKIHMDGRLEIYVQKNCYKCSALYSFFYIHSRLC